MKEGLLFEDGFQRRTLGQSEVEGAVRWLTEATSSEKESLFGSAANNPQQGTRVEQEITSTLQ